MKDWRCGDWEKKKVSENISVRKPGVCVCVSREEKKRYFCEIFSVIEDLEKQNPFPGEMEKRGGAEKRRKRDLRLKFWIRVIRLETISTERSAVRLCIGLWGLSLFLNGVWVNCSHLIALKIPVEPIGGALVWVFLLRYLANKEEPRLQLLKNTFWIL